MRNHRFNRVKFFVATSKNCISFLMMHETISNTNFSVLDIKKKSTFRSIFKKKLSMSVDIDIRSVFLKKI